MNARPLASLEAAWPNVCRALMSCGRLPRTDALFQSAKARLVREIVAAHDVFELAQRWDVTERQVRRVIERYFAPKDRPSWKRRESAEEIEA